MLSSSHKISTRGGGRGGQEFQHAKKGKKKRSTDGKEKQLPLPSLSPLREGEKRKKSFSREGKRRR